MDRLDSEDTRFDQLYFCRHFNALLTKLGVDGQQHYTIGRSIFARMSNENLTYHNYEHVLNLIIKSIDYDIELTLTEQLAIWFHDVVYVPLAKFELNEINSALFMRASMQGLIDHKILADAERIIWDTSKHLTDFTPFSENVLDLDMAHFADKREKYNISTKNLIKEFENAGVNRVDFNIGRKTFLQKLLSKKNIYRSKYFIDNCEDKARENIRLDLEELAL